MRVDETNNTFTIFFYIILGKTYEFDIVIIYPFGVTLVQLNLSTRLFLVTLH